HFVIHAAHSSGGRMSNLGLKALWVVPTDRLKQPRKLWRRLEPRRVGKILLGNSLEHNPTRNPVRKSGVPTPERQGWGYRSGLPSGHRLPEAVGESWHRC